MNELRDTISGVRPTLASVKRTVEEANHSGAEQKKQLDEELRKKKAEEERIRSEQEAEERRKKEQAEKDQSSSVAPNAGQKGGKYMYVPLMGAHLLTLQYLFMKHDINIQLSNCCL